MKKFNLRVYGILINENEEVLLSTELRFGKPMIKFPGGGLEIGEGQKDCLIREFQEECGINVQVGELFYVNDFYQESAFRKNEQLISFYYHVHYREAHELMTVPMTYVHENDGEKLVWHPLSAISDHDMTFPIDKKVANLLKKS